MTPSVRKQKLAGAGALQVCSVNGSFSGPQWPSASVGAGSVQRVGRAD